MLKFCLHFYNIRKDFVNSRKMEKAACAGDLWHFEAILWNGT